MLLGEFNPDAHGIMNQLGGNGMQLIQKIIMNGSQNACVFSNIPQNFSHLRIYSVGNCGVNCNFSVLINGITTTTYDWGTIQLNSSLVGTGGIGDVKILGPILAINATPALGGVFIFDFPFYGANPFNKTVYSMAGSPCNVNGETGIYTGSNRSTAPITSITLANTASSNFTAGMPFSLYGIL